jgi:hypothetical protein
MKCREYGPWPITRLSITQYNDSQHNGVIRNTQHNKLMLSAVYADMLSYAFFTVMLSVICHGAKQMSPSIAS